MHKALRLETVHPLKQGLKQENINLFEAIENTRNRTSTKTRIETENVKDNFFAALNSKPYIH